MKPQERLVETKIWNQREKKEEKKQPINKVDLTDQEITKKKCWMNQLEASGPDTSPCSPSTPVQKNKDFSKLNTAPMFSTRPQVRVKEKKKKKHK